MALGPRITMILVVRDDAVNVQVEGDAPPCFGLLRLDALLVVMGVGGPEDVRKIRAGKARSVFGCVARRRHWLSSATARAVAFDRDDAGLFDDEGSMVAHPDRPSPGAGASTHRRG